MYLYFQLQCLLLPLPLPAAPQPATGNPLQCSTCGVVVSSTSNLKRHFMTHTGERPYRCTVCGVTYTQSNNLKRHYMFTHGQQAQVSHGKPMGSLNGQL
ncbi:zinc finger protein 70-like [Frankliniella occidentalis]|uniref:Zinc finger protein 70-like n=1 Tax=Frankliniella occidentalis TaxID=133901 RepID=A0A9C6U3Z9_FRAOC|nr:zinc finger protein 70-like [Frankliniella occidentalis]